MRVAFDMGHTYRVMVGCYEEHAEEQRKEAEKKEAETARGEGEGLGAALEGTKRKAGRPRKATEGVSGVLVNPFGPEVVVQMK